MEQVPVNLKNPGALPVVYVKSVRREDLPAEIALPEGVSVVYAIHGENGEPMALVGDRGLAFRMAREHNFAPVSVH
jgi:hypothetical protein